MSPLRIVVWAVFIAGWVGLLVLGINLRGQEVKIPVITTPDVQTYTPEPPRPVPFPRSTLPETWNPQP